MSVINSINKFFKGTLSSKNEIYLNEYFNLLNNICYTELALEKVINLITSCIISSEFKTYINSKNVKKHNYYLFNVSPNNNYNKYTFFRKIISQLVYNQESLVIEQNNMFYVTDSFYKEKKVYYDWYFHDIIIDNYSLKEIKYMKDVFYFSFMDEKVRNLISSLRNNYQELYNKLKKEFIQNNSRKIIMDYDSTNSVKNEKIEELQDTVNRIIRPFLNGDKDILALPKGYKLIDADNKTIKSSNINYDELSKIGKETFEYVAMVFDIPLDILYGNKAELREQFNLYLTNGFKPFKNMIECEINSKLYGEKNYLNENYLKIDTSIIKYQDIFEIATDADKLFRMGFTNNFIRKKLNEDEIEEEWANKAYVTKNYSNIEGGE